MSHLQDDRQAEKTWATGQDKHSAFEIAANFYSTTVRHALIEQGRDLHGSFAAGTAFLAGGERCFKDILPFCREVVRKRLIQVVGDARDRLYVRQESISVKHVVRTILGRWTHQIENVIRKRDAALDGAQTEHLLKGPTNFEAAPAVGGLFQHFHAELYDVCGRRLCGAESDEEVAHVKKGEALEW